MVIIVRGVFTKNNVRRILECLSIFEQYFSTSHLTFVFHPAAIPFPRAPVVRTATLPARKESGVHVKREYTTAPADDAGEWMVRLAGKRLGGTPRPTMRPRGAGGDGRPVLTDALCASEKSPLESDLHGAQLAEQRQLSPPPKKRQFFAVMPQCGRPAQRTGKTRPLRKGMRPSAFPPRGICRSWRVIGENDTTFPRPKQAGIWEVEVLRAV